MNAIDKYISLKKGVKVKVDRDYSTTKGHGAGSGVAFVYFKIDDGIGTEEQREELTSFIEESLKNYNSSEGRQAKLKRAAQEALALAREIQAVAEGKA